MTADQFRKFWNDKYPDSYPIGHELKWIYEDRWFRIHSLPESKRYAESEIEYNIIIERQNTLITDIFGVNSDFIILVGLYTNDLHNNNYEFLDLKGQFTNTDNIDLQKARPDEYDEEMNYEIYIKNEKWTENSFDHILRKIADDEIRVILINPESERLIIPYDGGIDIILKNNDERDFFKNKYSDWSQDNK